MTISKELLDELLKGVEQPEDLLGDKGLMKELKVRLMERMLGAELTAHLGYEPHGEPADQQANRHNGAMRKVLKGNDGAVPIDIPRDRDGSSEPELIRKGQTRIDGIDDKIIGLYAAGLSTWDIRAHLALVAFEAQDDPLLRELSELETKQILYPKIKAHAETPKLFWEAIKLSARVNKRRMDDLQIFINRKRRLLRCYHSEAKSKCRTTFKNWCAYLEAPTEVF